jgi:hypothetical protein
LAETPLAVEACGAVIVRLNAMITARPKVAVAIPLNIALSCCDCFVAILKHV